MGLDRLTTAEGSGALSRMRGAKRPTFFLWMDLMGRSRFFRGRIEQYIGDYYSDININLISSASSSQFCF